MPWFSKCFSTDPNSAWRYPRCQGGKANYQVSLFASKLAPSFEKLVDYPLLGLSKKEAQFRKWELNHR